MNSMVDLNERFQIQVLNVLPHTLTVKAMAARIRIPLRMHRPNHLRDGRQPANA